MGINVLSLFDGISCGQIALERIGIKVNNYFASEIDKYAIKVTQDNYPNTIQIGDVINVNVNTLPKIDLLIGGSPCHGFSFAGKQLNFDDPRSKLFFEFVRIKNECKPTYFLLENNKMKKEYQDIISQHLDVEPIKINSSLVSAQNRERLYWTNIPNVEIPKDRNIMLKDIIGEYDGIWVYPRGYNKGGVQKYKGKSPTITTSGWEHNFFIFRNGTKESFTPEICEKIQTLPIGYTKILSKSKSIKHIGNGWTVDVISHILSFINKKKVEM
jgi:site-specific DNA-cytosine methylase